MNMGKAIDIINEMINYRLSDDAIEEDEDDEYKKPEVRKEKNELIFLSILQIRLYLCEYKMIDVIVIIYGGIEVSVGRGIGRNANVMRTVRLRRAERASLP